MDGLDFDLDDGGRFVPIRFPESHLDSPIMTEPRDLLLREMGLSQWIESQVPAVTNTELPRFLRVEIEALCKWRDGHLGYENENYLPCYFLQQEVLRKVSLSSDQTVRRLVEKWRVSKDVARLLLAGAVVEITGGSVMSPLTQEMLKHCQAQSPFMSEPDETRYNSVSACSWLHIVQTARRLIKQRTNRFVSWNQNGVSICVSQHFVLLSVSNWWTALTFEELLMYADIYWERFLVVHYLHKLQIECPSDDNLPISMYYSWLDLYDDMLARIGRPAYKVLKEHEACIIGHILDLDEMSKQYNQLSQAVRESQSKVLTKFLPEQEVKQWFERRDKLISDLIRVRHCTEVFGMQKHFGHPPIDVIEAGGKVRKLATEVQFLHLGKLTKINSTWIWLFCKYYYFKHHHTWPACTYNELLVPHLNKHITHGTFPTDDEFRLHGHEFMLLRFEQVFSNECLYNLSVYCKDKALAPESDFWDCVYQIGHDKPRYNDSRRLIDRLVMDENFNPTQSMRDAIHHPVHRDDCLSFSLKEKEQGIGRPFGKSNYRNRLIQGMLETVFKDQISEVFSCITIGLPTHAMLSVMSSWTQNLNGSGLATACSFDFEKWNLRFCYEKTEKSALVIGELTGLGSAPLHFHLSHSGSLHFIGGQYTVPPGVTEANRHDPPESDLCWRNHMTGIEGLQQSLWTQFSGSTVIRGLVELACKGKVILQGDNEVVLLSIPKTEGVDQRDKAYKLTREYTDRVDEYTKAVHMPIKLEETYVSDRFLNYGKKMYYDGAQMPCAIKKICRLQCNAGGIYDSLIEQISANITTAISASEVGPGPMTCYHLGQRNAIFSVLHSNTEHVSLRSRQTLHPGIEKLFGKTTTVEDLACGFAVGTSLCGFGNPSFQNFFQHAASDPVTLDLSYLKAFVEVHPSLSRVWVNVFTQKRGDEKLVNLLQDPYGLNFVRPRPPQSIIRYAARQGLARFAKNPVFTSLFHEDIDQEDEELAEVLLNTIPCMPRMASEIASHTVSGIREKIIKHVDTTKTVCNSKIFSGGGETEYALKKNLVSVMDKLLYFSKPVTDQEREDTLGKLNLCEVDLADALRLYSWDRFLVGVTFPTTTRLAKVVEVINGVCPICETNKHEGVTPEFLLCRLDNKRDVIRERGPLHPYLGSTTSEKRGRPATRATEMSSPLRAAIDIWFYMNWISERDPATRRLALKLAQTRANVTEEILDLLTPNSNSKNPNHRTHDSTSRHTFSISQFTNIATNCHIETDYLGQWSGKGGARDSNIIFQALLLQMMAVAGLYAIHLPRPVDNRVFHGHLSECCVRDLPAYRVVFRDDTMEPVNIYQENPFVYDPRAPVIGHIRTQKNQGWVSRADMQDIEYTPDNIKFLSAQLGFWIAGLWMEHLAQIEESWTDMNEKAAAKLMIPLLNADIDSVLFWCGIRLTSTCPTLFSLILSERQATPIQCADTLQSLLISSITLPQDLSLVMGDMDCAARFYQIAQGSNFRQDAYNVERNKLLMFSQSVHKSLLSGFSRDLHLKYYFNLPDVSNLLGAAHCCWRDMAVVLFFLGNGLPLQYLHPVDVFSQLIEQEARPIDSSILMEHLCIRRTCDSEALRQLMKVVCVQGSWDEWASFLGSELNRMRVNADKASSMFPRTIAQAMIPVEVFKGQCVNFGPLATWSDSTSRVWCHSDRQTMTELDSLRKNRQDHFYAITGSNTKAHYKWSSILSAIPLKPDANCVTLAEGSGGVAALLYTCYKARRIFFNTLIDNLTKGQHWSSYVPLEFMSVVGSVEVLCGLGEILGAHNDLRLDETHQMIVSLNKDVDLVTSDMEFFGEDTVPYLDTMKKIISTAHSILKLRGICIVKTYLYYTGTFYQILAHAGQLFSDVRIYRSYHSSHESTEIFLVMLAPVQRPTVFVQRIPYSWKLVVEEVKKHILLRAHSPLQTLIPWKNLQTVHQLFIEHGFRRNTAQNWARISGIMSDARGGESPSWWSQECLRGIKVNRTLLLASVKAFGQHKVGEGLLRSVTENSKRYLREICKLEVLIELLRSVEQDPGVTLNNISQLLLKPHKKSFTVRDTNTDIITAWSINQFSESQLKAFWKWIGGVIYTIR